MLQRGQPGDLKQFYNLPGASGPGRLSDPDHAETARTAALPAADAHADGCRDSGGDDDPGDAPDPADGHARPGWLTSAVALDFGRVQHAKGWTLSASVSVSMLLVALSNPSFKPPTPPPSVASEGNRNTTAWWSVPSAELWQFRAINCLNRERPGQRFAVK